MASTLGTTEAEHIFGPEEFSWLEKRMAAHYAITNVLSAANNLSKVAPKILREVADVMKWDAAILWEVDFESQVMKCKEVWTTKQLDAADFIARTRQSQISRSTGLPGKAWSSGKLVWTTAVDEPIVDQRGAIEHSVGCVPIILRDEVIGALQFFSKLESKPDVNSQEMLKVICTQVGLFMERNRAEENLRESEARYRLLADTSLDVLITIDDESHIVFVNKASERVFGYAPSELLGHKLTLIIPDHKQIAFADIKKSAAARHFELFGKKKDGSELSLNVCFAEYLGNGRRYATGIISDITDRKRTESVLQATQQKLQSVLDTSPFAQIVVASPPMLTLLKRVKKAAASEASILVQGETGSGKECIALLIHQQSQRAGKAFVARNCCSIPQHLFESEMFGHKKGAFTGADRDRKGAFAEADGGTLFLDEIGDLEYSLQTKLLRAIQEKIIHPVGSDKDVHVDPRIVCATNKDLLACIKAHEFRDDLYYRVATVMVAVPPLRQRREDIVPLARHFVGMASKLSHTLSPEAEERLMKYDWPGNVRELRSLMEQAVIFAIGNVIQADELGFPQKHSIEDPNSQLLEAVERRHILEVLKNCDGNKTVAAKVLGLARSTLVLKLKIGGEVVDD